MKQDHSDFFIDRVRSKSPTTGGSPLNPQILKFGDGSEIVNMGLTKREYFAAMAMQALIPVMQNSFFYDKNDIAQDSVNYADALIEALNK
jgi:hypothetical protein